MKFSLEIEYEQLRSIAFNAIGVNLAPIGTPFTNPIRILFIQNLTDELLIFGFLKDHEALVDHEALPAQGFKLLDITTNKTSDSGFAHSVGKRVFVRHIAGAAPTTGNVYVSAAFAREL